MVTVKTEKENHNETDIGNKWIAKYVGDMGMAKTAYQHR